MRLKQFAIVAFLAVSLAACTLPPLTGAPAPVAKATASPEAQIATGANANAAAISLGTAALQQRRITVAQAKAYRAIVGAAAQALDEASTVLTKCRAETGSTEKTTPDPCRASVAAMIQLALTTVANAKAAFDATK